MAIKVVVREAQGWFKGERKQLIFPVLDAAGVPIDVSTWAMQWALMTRANATTHLVTKTTGAGIYVEDNADGIPNTVVVNIEPADLDAVRPNVELYQELKRTDADPNVLAYGPVTVLQSGIV